MGWRKAFAIAGEAHKPELFDTIAARGVPYVVTYSYRTDSPHPCIGFDNHDAFYRMTRHLLDRGHRTIGLIVQPVAGNDRIEARVAGVRIALADQGLGLAGMCAKGSGAPALAGKACARS